MNFSRDHARMAALGRASAEWPLVVRSILLCALLFLLQSITALAQSQGTGLIYQPVLDNAGALGSDERTKLANKLAKFERDCGSQVAVVLVATTKPYGIESYTNTLANEWKLGRQGVGDGAILLLAMQDREMRIEVARDMERYLTDLQSAQILQRQLKPSLSDGKTYQGIDSALDAIFGAFAPVCANASATYESPATSRSTAELIGIAVGFLLIVGFFWLMVSAFCSVRPLGMALAGCGGVFMGWLFINSGSDPRGALPTEAGILVGVFMAFFFWKSRFRLGEWLERQHSLGMLPKGNAGMDAGQTSVAAESSDSSSNSSFGTSASSSGGGDFAGGGASGRW